MSSDSHLPSDQRSMRIDSMGASGDYLRFFVNDRGEMYIAMVDEDRDSGAFFDFEQQKLLRDWLNKVLP